MRTDRQPCVYILVSGRNGTLYIGVTSNLAARLAQHRNGATPGFASRYGVTRLVHIQTCDDMPTAIAREKQLKRWHRDWKLNLIERDNPHWLDLAPSLGVAEAAEPGRTVDAETSSA
jgi:putative endonuclease